MNAVMRPLGQRGITLLECLVAIVLISLVGGAIYTFLYQGYRLWHRALQENVDYGTEFFFEKAAMDLRNSFPFRPDVLVGASRSLQFYTLVTGSRNSLQPGESLLRQPARVRYHFEDREKTLFRTLESYQHLLYPRRRAERQPRERVAEGIHELEFEYFSYDEQMGKYRWMSHWHLPCLPPAVKIRLEYGNLKKLRRAERVIVLPQGGCAGGVS